MADNFPFTPGAGLTGASDDVGGVHYPRAKSVWGADGVANDTDVAAGMALPVQLRDVAGAEVLGQVTGSPTANTVLDRLKALLTGIILAAGTAIIGRVGHDTTGIGHGVKTVAAAGTDEALAGSTAAKWVTVQAQSDNTGLIAVGAAGVDATIATGTGVLLAPRESINLPCENLADVFIDSTVSGDGVRYTYGT